MAIPRVEKTAFPLESENGLLVYAKRSFSQKIGLFFRSPPEGAVRSNSQIGAPLRRYAYFFRAKKSHKNRSNTEKLKKSCGRRKMSPLCGDTLAFAGEAAISGKNETHTKTPTPENGAPLRRYAHFLRSAEN